MLSFFRFMLSRILPMNAGTYGSADLARYVQTDLYRKRLKARRERPHHVTLSK